MTIFKTIVKRSNILSPQRTRCFLELDDLPVGELATVVDHVEAVLRVAVGAERGLLQTPAVQLADLGLQANGAHEQGLAHLGQRVGATDHHPANCDQAIDI